MLNGPSSKRRRTRGKAAQSTRPEKHLNASALQRLHAGELVFGAIQAMPGPVGTEIAIRAGADFVILDCEHGLADEVAHKASLQVLAKVHAFSVLRVRPGDLDAVATYARLGADMILMPNVGSAAAAQAFVAAGSQGPGDGRSATRMPTPLLMAMIESKAAVEQIQDIAATPGLNGVVVGPNDLCADLGEDVDFAAPAFQEALTAIEHAAAQAGIVLGAGIYHGISVSRLIEGGHTFILAASDLGALEQGYDRAFDAVRRLPGAPP